MHLPMFLSRCIKHDVHLRSINFHQKKYLMKNPNVLNMFDTESFCSITPTLRLLISKKSTLPINKNIDCTTNGIMICMATCKERKANSSNNNN